MTDHTDTYSLAGLRACVLTYPPDLTVDEVDGITDWLTLVVRKLGRIATPHAVRDALRVAELADTDAHLADAPARCDRLRAEKGELETELVHQRKLVETLCERVEAQAELLSQRAAKPAAEPLAVLKQINAGLDAMIRSAKPPKVVVLDDPEADLPAVLPVPTEPYPAVPAVVENLPEVLKNGYDHDPAPQTYRDDKEHVPPGERHGNSPKPERRQSPKEKGRATRLKVAAALVAKPLTATEIHAATGIPQGTLSGVLPVAVHGWWTKRFHHGSAPYELTDAGRAALRAEGIDAPDPPAPKGIDRDRERCRLIAEEMVKLVAPRAAVVIAVGAGLELDYVERQLERHPEWFARVEGGGDYYRLTAQGRELANEAEAA